MSKPNWDSHEYPAIFNFDGCWFGVVLDWDFKAHISQGWKGLEVSLLSKDGEFLCYGTHPNWQESYELRPKYLK